MISICCPLFNLPSVVEAVVGKCLDRQLPLAVTFPTHVDERGAALSRLAVTSAVTTTVFNRTMRRSLSSNAAS